MTAQILGQGYNPNDTLGPDLRKVTSLLTHVPDCIRGYVGAGGNGNGGVCVSHCQYLSPHQPRQYVTAVHNPTYKGDLGLQSRS